ncbi:unnamed protein product [Urochloa decumbens]|uniref:Calmodulin-binding domain-containing protein n=1 Tax=Urochloa decumbens TaxID=240449 RepID=A0ABC9DIV2_9POAL
MATRPSPRSSPRGSDPSRPSTGRSSAADKPVPSFLRPTVSSSLHSSSSSSSLISPSTSASSISKGGAAAVATARRSADKAPAAQSLGALRPITPKDKAKAPAAAAASSAPARRSPVSPKQLMQKATGALKATSKPRGKKGNEAASSSAAASASGGKGAGAGASAARAKGDAARSHPGRKQPQTPAEPSPAVTPMDAEEPVLLEPESADQTEERVATSSSQEAVTDIKTVEERHHEERAGVEEDEVEKIVVEEPGAVKVPVPGPQLQEEKPQSSAVAETEMETQKNAEVAWPAVVVEEAAGKEAVMQEAEDEPATGTGEEKVAEETKAEERRQEDALKPEEITENSETCMVSEEQPNEESNVKSEERSKEGSSAISEQQKEADPAPLPKHEEVDEEPEMAAGSSESAPTTPLTEADDDEDEDEETMPKQVSASEPVTPVAEAISKGKAGMIETQQSMSAPVTPANAAKKKGPSKLQSTTIAEESSTMTFMGRKVKTAMEKRSEEEQPKKKEVARSNDVLEEAKSKLMEKRKSKVKALVGAFETVMDSPRAS